MGRRELIKDLQAEIKMLNAEIKKREGIIEQVMGLEDISGVAKTRKRKPGRPPGKATKKAGKAAKTVKRRGRPPKNGRRKKKVARKKYVTPVGELIKDVLRTMKQPTLVDDLAEKVHKKHPGLGGVKYRAIVSSMVSRDSRFKRIGKQKVALKGK
ncbi:hypothetical protein J7L05_07965 [bacterium]|nr:hypothetical protein [bacterium]